MPCISLADNRLMGVTQLALTWVGWQSGEDLRRLACKFDLDQSERKSSQVKARSARKARALRLKVPMKRKHGGPEEKESEERWKLLRGWGA